VTHDHEVAEAGDRIVRMRDGRIEGDGATQTSASEAATTVS
jgi:ABC-type lipoprotein export system ATPase subunit